MPEPPWARDEERVLVLGAGGWFGCTMLDAFKEWDPSTVTAVGTRPRSIRVGRRDWPLVAWDFDAIERWQPTIVLNFAFLTKDLLQSVGLREFVRVNRMLSQRFLWAAALRSVRLALTVSSGAATQISEGEDLRSNPYGFLKREEELLALRLVETSRAVVVVRAFSVSGPWVQRPESYAFSDLILQAAAGRVLVTAQHPTYRRYVSVADLLHVGLSLGTSKWSGVVEGGGELIEIGDLAQRIVQIVNPSAQLARVPITGTEPRVYASDGLSWLQACDMTGHVPIDLNEQIDDVWGWAQSGLETS